MREFKRGRDLARGRQDDRALAKVSMVAENIERLRNLIKLSLDTPERSNKIYEKYHKRVKKMAEFFVKERTETACYEKGRRRRKKNMKSFLI